MKNTNKLIVSMHKQLMDADVTQGNEVFIGQCEVWLTLLFLEEQKIKKWALTQEQNVELASMKTYHQCKSMLATIVKTMRMYEDCERRKAKFGKTLALKRLKRLASHLKNYEEPAVKDYEALLVVANQCENLMLTVTDYTYMLWNVLGRMEDFIQSRNETKMEKLRERTQQQRYGLEMIEEGLEGLYSRANNINEKHEDMLQEVHDILEAINDLAEHVATSS